MKYARVFILPWKHILKFSETHTNVFKIEMNRNFHRQEGRIIFKSNTSSFDDRICDNMHFEANLIDCVVALPDFNRHQFQITDYG